MDKKSVPHLTVYLHQYSSMVCNAKHKDISTKHVSSHGTLRPRHVYIYYFVYCYVNQLLFAFVQGEYGVSRHQHAPPPASANPAAHLPLAASKHELRLTHDQVCGSNYTCLR